MGQTLTHGVYLPDEGERNCYSGLAANWQLLDSSVGTIADHTTALAGKAPAVHTHTKSDITDFPAYGTTAGTICEGNDSRLSDARTPVAHTHTKSDVTDLLNSNFIPSANNSYDLGSSSYQWNNVYSKGYYYNGVAWGLDKDNTWTHDQTYKTGYFGQMIWLQDSDLDLSVNGNTGLTDTYQHMIHWCDKNKTVYSTIQSWTNSSENVLVLRSRYRTDASTVRELSVRFTSTATNKIICPETNGDTDLGISTNKWKSLNGINPGALSLPDYLRILNIDTTNWSKTAGQNIYTPAFDGWLQITIPNDTDGNGEKSNFITILDSGFDPFTGITASDSKDYRIQITFPVVANHEYCIYINSYSQTIMAARLIKCLGNVV